ncbi:MAG: cell division protein FtsQ/DivIB [Lachnospira sp.]
MKQTVNITDIKRRNEVKRQRIKLLAIISGIVLFLAGLFAVMFFCFRTKDITYEGNTHYSDEELDGFIFDGKNPNTLIYRFFGDKKRSIPFIQRYDVEIDWPDNIHVTVYEKPVVGYVKYMGSNMYFDKDGTVVESTDEYFANVPEIVGIKYNSIVLNQKLLVEDDLIFTRILDLTQSFEKYDLNVSKIYFDNTSNVILYIGDIKVSLGNDTDYTDKLFELKQLSGSFGKLKGTLYLDDYNGTDESIIFKKEN